MDPEYYHEKLRRTIERLTERIAQDEIERKEKEVRKRQLELEKAQRKRERNCKHVLESIQKQKEDIQFWYELINQKIDWKIIKKDISDKICNSAHWYIYKYQLEQVDNEVYLEYQTNKIVLEKIYDICRNHVDYIRDQEWMNQEQLNRQIQLFNVFVFNESQHFQTPIQVIF